MSYETEVAILLGTANKDDEARILAALDAMTEAHDKCGAFEKVTKFEQSYVSFVSVVVGSVNHLDEALFFETLRNAASTPAYSSYYVSLGVLLNGQDDSVPRARTLDNAGNWA